MKTCSYPGLVEVLLVGLALSIGWGIRGNYGHEHGAMVPGAFAAMSAVLLSGRSDWQRRIAFFGMFGALGWSFGGSMSYGHVIGYTHSGDSLSVVYGFACLYVIGFLWGALGGAGTTLPAALSRENLTVFFTPLLVVFVSWLLEYVAVETWFPVDEAYRHQSPLYWHDTDWLAAVLATVAVLMLTVVRREVDLGSSLALHMSVGWLLGALVLVGVLGLRMTPPRGDNWAGCVGMVIGVWVYCWRHGLPQVARASLICGFVGGFGFATAQLLKLIGITTGWQTNWHSLMEQTYGFINGIGVAVAMFWLARACPEVRDEPPVRRWTEYGAVAFVLLGITYLNLRKNPQTWTATGDFPSDLYGLSAVSWFDIGYVIIAIAFVALAIAHCRRALPVIPETWLGAGELLYLLFLWWMIVGNFERALLKFAPVRLVTEGVVYFNGIVCTVGVLMLARAGVSTAVQSAINWHRNTVRIICLGSALAVLSVVGDWAIVRAVYGDKPAPHSAKHIRFGPNATAKDAALQPAQPHP